MMSRNFYTSMQGPAAYILQPGRTKIIYRI